MLVYRTVYLINNLSQAILLLREPVDVKVELKGRPVGGVVAVKVLLEKVHDGVDVVVVAGRGKDALVGVVTGVKLVKERIDGNFPEAGKDLGRTLQRAAEVGRLSADAVLSVQQPLTGGVELDVLLILNTFHVSSPTSETRSRSTAAATASITAA